MSVAISRTSSRVCSSSKGSLASLAHLQEISVELRVGHHRFVGSSAQVAFNVEFQEFSYAYRHVAVGDVVGGVVS